MKVSVIIPTVDRLTMLQGCVSSIREHTSVPFEIVIVDSSTDDFTEYYARGAGLHYWKIPSIVGFSKAVNAGAKVCSGHYLVWLNDDCKVYPNWLTRMLEEMDRDVSIGIGVFFFSDARWPDTGFHVFFYRNKVYPNFGCVRRTVWEQLRGFNENYFSYGAEVDIACRCRELGYEVVFVPGARVHHHYVQDVFRKNWISMQGTNYIDRRVEEWGSESDDNLHWMTEDGCTETHSEYKERTCLKK